METQQLATFYLDNLLFGVEVRQVQEVIRFQEMTRVPLAPPVIQGLINLRGQIVTAVELRHRLALPPREPNRLPMNVVVRTPEGAVSLLVDEIGDVVEVSASEAVAMSIDHPPELAPVKKKAAKAEPLIDRLGGQTAIEAVVAALYDRILADAELAPFFRQVDMALVKRKQAEFLGQAFGGPATYKGASMKQVHATMGIESRHFDRVANHLAATLEALGVAQELTREAVGIVASLKTEIVGAASAA